LLGELASIPGLPYPERLLMGQSAAHDRLEYLRRPDLGRRLSDASRAELSALKALCPQAFDLSIVIADGLSSRAIATNAAPFLREFLPLVSAWRLSPLIILTQGRVAVADEVGSLLGARAVAILIGERPGLSSPDSMGIYLTWAPQPGITKDDRRNCISNVRPAGMGYPQAASKLAYLLEKASSLGLSGVGLKDDQGSTLETSPLALPDKV
jgi:ethanolamine ammonia-lyase small subunit